MEDEQILSLFFERNETAIAETQEKYGHRLLHTSRSITGNSSDAEECVNDTYLEAWRSIPPHRPPNLFAYLCRIVRHLSLDVCDRRNAGKRRGQLVELTAEMCECIPDPDSAPGGLSDAVSDSQHIRAAINTFLSAESEEGQYMFIKRYFFGASIGEIARQMGRTEVSVTSALYRARARLKKQLEMEDITL